MKRISLLIAIFLCILGMNSSAICQNQGSSQRDLPLRIKKKPSATARDCSQASGTTRVRVTFSKTAQVTEVALVRSSGCDSFDKSAIDAAKKIIFEPAVKKGEPIDVIRTLEYVFYI